MGKKAGTKYLRKWGEREEKAEGVTIASQRFIPSCNQFSGRARLNWEVEVTSQEAQVRWANGMGGNGVSQRKGKVRRKSMELFRGGKKLTGGRPTWGFKRAKGNYF